MITAVFITIDIHLLLTVFGSIRRSGAKEAQADKLPLGNPKQARCDVGHFKNRRKIYCFRDKNNIYSRVNVVNV